ncbi:MULTISPECIES: cupin domain-containing protein [unclassified Brachybacterium]|uniref:cupin domain-containing protein n=1 Tax=unclassified Brachybacterium TaxID=2623841 RepID=UPI0036178550
MSIETIDLADLPSGNFEGRDHGASISIIVERDLGRGLGPRLHRHPYDETFLVQAGSAVFTVADRQVTVSAGQLLVAPANTPHRFESLGGYSGIHIHSSDRFITEWLEE